MQRPALGESLLEFDAPTYQDCAGPNSDLAFEFYDDSGRITEPLTWVTIDKSTNKVILAPQLAEFQTYIDASIF